MTEVVISNVSQIADAVYSLLQPDMVNIYQAVVQCVVSVGFMIVGAVCAFVLWREV